MKRNRTNRQLLGLESLETRQLLAGLTTPIVAPPTRLPVPTTTTTLVARPTTTTPLAAPVVNTTPLQTSNLLGTPLTTQASDLGTREPQSPTSSIVVQDPVSGSQLDKLPSDPTEPLEGQFAGEDENLALFDLDAFFSLLARTAPDVFATVAASIVESAPELGETRYGSAQEMFGAECLAGANWLRPVVVVYEEGTGITKINDGLDDKETSEFEKTLLNFIGWQENPTTATSEAHKQAEEQEQQLFPVAEGNGNESDGNESDNGAATDDSSETVCNPVVYHYSSEDESWHYFRHADGTVVTMNLDTGVRTVCYPDGSVTETDADGNTTEYKPSTPAGDEMPLEDWIQEQIDQAMAEMRAAQNYQSSGGDIDWGDFDTAGGFLVASGATIDSLILQLCGEDIRPNTTDQGEFQQSDQGDVDPNPNDGN